MWRSTGRVGIWRFPLCLPEGGGPLPGLALKGKPACSGPGQGTGQHTPSTRLMPIWGRTDVCPGMGEQGHRKPGPLSGLRDTSRAVEEPRPGTRQQVPTGPACAFWPLLPPCTFWREGPWRQSLGGEEGEQDGGPCPPHLLNSESRPGRCRGYHLHHHSPAALSGLIPEEGVAWLPVCEGQGGVDPAPPHYR